MFGALQWQSICKRVLRPVWHDAVPPDLHCGAPALSGTGRVAVQRRPRKAAHCATAARCCIHPCLAVPDTFTVYYILLSQNHARVCFYQAVHPPSNPKNSFSQLSRGTVTVNQIAMVGQTPIFNHISNKVLLCTTSPDPFYIFLESNHCAII